MAKDTNSHETNLNRTYELLFFFWMSFIGFKYWNWFTNHNNKTKLMNSLILKASLKRSLKSGEPRSVTYSHYDRVSKKVVEKKIQRQSKEFENSRSLHIRLLLSTVRWIRLTDTGAPIFKTNLKHFFILIGSRSGR